MDADLIALRDEIDARLVEVDLSRGTCSGHPALARAIATLLRCQRAQLNQRAAHFSPICSQQQAGVSPASWLLAIWSMLVSWLVMP